jgi:hypothetical protein
MQLVPVERPITPVTGAAQFPQFRYLRLRIAFRGHLFEIFPNKLIDAFPSGFGGASGAFEQGSIDGQCQIHRFIPTYYVCT